MLTLPLFKDLGRAGKNYLVRRVATEVSIVTPQYLFNVQKSYEIDVTLELFLLRELTEVRIATHSTVPEERDEGSH